MALPTLTPEQRADAAQRATAARRVRADVRAKLKVGELRISDVIALSATDEAIAKLKVASLLEALPGVGKAKAANIMSRHTIAASRRVRGLGQHQRESLMAEFG
ncbi:MAG: integration host factor, actinobacterial type [Candidatus Nanopelagicales bacterium]